jgi:putative endonuclease
MNWQVYIILCSDNSLYTGITTDLKRRFHQHAHGRGAKYFRGREPTDVMYLESGLTRSTASKRELQIKKLTRAGKYQLISSEMNEFSHLHKYVLSPERREEKNCISNFIS